jgi:hypothetical protein
MIATASPVSFIYLNLSMSAFKYAPTTSAVATSRPSLASMITEYMRESVATVGDDISDFLYRDLCVLPYAHVCHFNFPDFFSFTRFTALGSLSLSTC